MRNATIAALLTLVISQAASAQVFSRSTPGPDRPAAGEAWYASREPLYLLGDYYYPAGSTRFFDGDRMVASTFFEGVPIYQDTTLEPYSVVFVPIGRGLVQPYERRRRGELAGTTGSFVPSFPVQNYAEAPALTAQEQLAIEEGRTEPRELMQATDESFTPEPVGTIGVRRVEEDIVTPTARRLLRPGGVTTAKRPEYASAVWVSYEGSRYFLSGPSVDFAVSDYRRVGDYKGFAVFKRTGGDDAVIYIVTPEEGLAAPYKKR